MDVGKGYWGSLYGEGVGGMMKASAPDKIKSREGEGVQRLPHHREGDAHHDQGQRRDDGGSGLPDAAGQGREAGPADGIIAIQVHAGYPKMRVEFKDIKFTDLSKKK